MAQSRVRVGLIGTGMIAQVMHRPHLWDNGLAIAARLGYPGELRCSFTTVILPKLRKFDESLAVYSDERMVTIAFPSPFLKNAPTVVEEWRMEGGAYQEVRRQQSTVSSHQIVYPS